MSEFPNVAELVGKWHAARTRTLLARLAGKGPEQAADYWTELRLGTEIAREVLSGRWLAIADLLRLGAVESWAQVGEALAVTETEARDGFHLWVTRQRDLYRRTASVGLTEVDAAELTALSEAVTW